MEKHCTSVYFVLKKSRKDKNGLSPIVTYINVNTERASYYTGKKIKASDWDAEKQLVNFNLRKMFFQSNKIRLKFSLFTLVLVNDN